MYKDGGIVNQKMPNKGTRATLLQIDNFLLGYKFGAHLYEGYTTHWVFVCGFEKTKNLRIRLTCLTTLRIHLRLLFIIGTILQ